MPRRPDQTGDDLASSGCGPRGMAETPVACCRLAPWQARVWVPSRIAPALIRLPRIERLAGLGRNVLYTLYRSADFGLFYKRHNCCKVLCSIAFHIKLNIIYHLRRVLCDPLRHRDVQYPDLESNQAGTAAQRWSALGKPHAIRYTIGTNTPGPTTGFAPAWSGFGHRREAWSAAAFLNRATSATKAGVQGFEPCGAALEAASSPRRTLLYRPSVLREARRGRWSAPRCPAGLRSIGKRNGRA